MRLLVLGGVLLIAAGCGPSGPEIAPTSGTVKLADGKPAAGCVIEFMPASGDTSQLIARGETQADGTFKLQINVDGKLKDGAVVGANKAIVVPSAASFFPGAKPVNIPPRYNKYDTSKLTFEVKPGVDNNFTITLEPK